jgi:hypothetical protein
MLHERTERGGGQKDAKDVDGFTGLWGEGVKCVKRRRHPGSLVLANFAEGYFIVFTK